MIDLDKTALILKVLELEEEVKKLNYTLDEVCNWCIDSSTNTLPNCIKKQGI